MFIIPSTHSGLRLSLALVMVLAVVSSLVVTLVVNPALAKPSYSTTSTPLPTISTTPSAPSTIGQVVKDFFQKWWTIDFSCDFIWTNEIVTI
jgi:hypothetical protein